MGERDRQAIPAWFAHLRTSGNGPVLLTAGLFVLIQLATGPRYGLFRDEFYYLSCASHLDWGFVDHPPLSVLVLAVVRALFGDGLLAIRLVPALLGGALIVLTARLAREMGAGPFGQGLAAIAVATAPQFLALFGTYSMNPFDALSFTGSAFLVVRLVAKDDRRLWIALGAVLGAALMNKISILNLGLGLAVGIVATPLRRHLATWRPWGAAILSLLLFSPYLLWQIAHGWPTLEFMSNASRLKNAAVAPLEFLGNVILSMGPLSAPLWIGGLLWMLVGRDGRKFRVLGIAFLVVLGVLLAGRSKTYYVAAAIPMLLAAGAAAWERLLAGPSRLWGRIVIPALLLVQGALLAPFAIPVLPVERFIAYQAFLRMAPRQEENNRVGPLPQYFADRFGWREMTQSVDRAYKSLSPEERSRAAIVGSNYGEAAAVTYYGRAFGLPPAISQHNSFYLWGPGRGEVEVVITIGMSPEDLSDAFESVVPAGRVVSPYAMPYETADPILIARKLKVPLTEAWRRGKNFI